MLEAYFDESGIHDPAIVCVIAGYFGGVGQWRKFELLWRKILKEAKIEVSNFHAKDFVKKLDRHSVLRDLAHACGEYKIYPVSVGVVVEDFNSFSLDDRRFLTGASVQLNPDSNKFTSTGSPNRPYYLPFQHCVKQAASYTPTGSRVHLNFGLDSSFAGYAVNLVNQIKSDPIAPYKDRIGTVQFPPAKETPQLQAADLLVYLTYTDMQERHLNNGWDEQPSGLLKICLQKARVREDFVYYNKQCIEMTLRDPHFDMAAGL
jgi:hypothetical protein